MNNAPFIIFIAVIVGTLLLKVGIDERSITISIVMAALVAIPWFFETRDRSRPPSRVERALAALWVWFRRIVCSVAGAALFFGGVAFAVSHGSGEGIMSTTAIALVFMFMGLFAIYVGFVGQGHNRNAFRDDIAQHRANKQRYKWWL